MVTYEYIGEQELVIPSVPITVKQGDKFEAPEGLNVPGLKVIDSKTAPAVKAKETVKEEIKSSAPSDISAGA